MSDPFVPSPSEFVPFLLDVLEGAALFVATVAAIYLPGRYLVIPVVERVLDEAAVDETLRLPLVKVLKASIGLFALFTAVVLSGFGGALTATAAVTAGATIAIGFAAQDVLGNFVSGVFIVTDPTFNIGDWIEWDGNAGIIEDISFRVTRVRTFDNELITVPNADLTTNAVTNPVSRGSLRINVEFGIGYDDDIDHAREVVRSVAHEHEEVLNRPGATVRVTELAPSAVVLTARFWIENPARTNFVRVRSEFVQGVKEAFDREGIEMPYPYRQLTGDVAVAGAGEMPRQWPEGFGR